MSLRPFLSHLERHPDAARLAEPGARAFVSQSLRPYLIAAVADRDERRPTVVVAGDDRAARDLAADLRAWLRPRPVRFYPSRGVAYESHLSPPAHLVGLRVAALDALLEPPGGAEAPVIVVSAVALSEKVPDPALRPHGFVLRTGDLLDLEECAADLVAAGYERTDQVEDRGQFAVRGGLLDVYPATEERAVRVDLFDDEIESLRWFSTFTQRSLGEADVVEISPAAELAAEHRELAELAALEAPDERPDIAELLPVGRLPRAARARPARGRGRRRGGGGHRAGAARPLGGRLRGLPRRRRALPLRQAGRHPRRAGGAPPAAAVLHLGHAGAGVPRPGRRLRRPLAARGRAGAREARPLRLHRAGHVAEPGRRASARRTTSRASRRAGRRTPSRGLVFQEANLRDGFVAPGLNLAAIPEHRLIHHRRAAARPARRGRGLLRSFTDLRTGDFIVHEDHGVARFAGFDTKTVGGITRDYLNLEFQGSDKVFMPVDQLAKISRYVGADGAHPPLSKLGGTRWEADQGARAPGRAGARRGAAQPLRGAPPPARPRLRARLGLAARVRGRLPVPGDARPARGDRAGQGRHGVRAARWTA